MFQYQLLTCWFYPIACLGVEASVNRGTVLPLLFHMDQTILESVLASGTSSTHCSPILPFCFKLPTIGEIQHPMPVKPEIKIVTIIKDIFYMIHL